MLPPYLQSGPRAFTDGANFASAGSGVLVETGPGTVSTHLSLQINQAFYE